MKGLHSITFILLIVGGLNWLLIGVFDWSISDVLGDSVSRIIYVLVGLSALYELAMHKKMCKRCNPEGGMMK